jgi:beta-galactosidase
LGIPEGRNHQCETMIFYAAYGKWKKCINGSYGRLSIQYLGFAYAGVLTLFTSVCAIAGHVRVGEKAIHLGNTWKFSIDAANVGQTGKWYAAGFDDKGWGQMEVPGLWYLQNEYTNYKGKAWYRTHFATPAAANKRIMLAFGEVGMSYKVFINGVQIADILCGNYEEAFDITGRLNKAGDNVLAVVVNNTLAWGAYWSWGGIRRPVRLLLREPVYIERQEVVATPDLASGMARIRTAVYIRNSSKVPQQISLKQTIVLANDTMAKTSLSPVTIAAETVLKYFIDEVLSQKQVKLWHFDHPNLYHSVVALLSGQRVVYEYNDRFGIRKIELHGYRLKLNGEPVRLAGFNWVADDRTTGSTLPEFRYKEDIDLMKAAGANMARLSHRPLPAGVIADAAYLSDQGTPNWGFMGMMVGVYAFNRGTGMKLPADFDWFRIQGK